MAVDKTYTESARQILGERLRGIRQEKELSQVEVSGKSGLQPSQVVAIENGTWAYTIDSLLAYLHAIGVADDIVESKPDKVDRSLTVERGKK